MTKAEELKILEAIEGLILEAGPDSYIRMTFAGVPEICRRNIEDDFGDIPVQDLEEERKRHEKDNAEMGAKLLRLEHENQAMQTHLDEAEEQIALLQRTADEWENNANDSVEHYEKIIAEKDKQMSEMRRDIAGCEECNKELRNEIIRLKAEIYDWERS